MKTVCLLTGLPGSGKTTLIKQAVAGYKGKACGFYTEEIRENGERKGFRLITLDGKTATLSHIDLKSPYCVGKYGVDVGAIETVGIPALKQTGCDLVVLDEIGKMEMLSLDFRQTVTELIGSGKRTLGTILFHHHTWSDIIKARPEVNLILLNRNNFEEKLGEVKNWLEETA